MVRIDFSESRWLEEVSPTRFSKQSVKFLKMETLLVPWIIFPTVFQISNRLAHRAVPNASTRIMSVIFFISQ